MKLLYKKFRIKVKAPDIIKKIPICFTGRVYTEVN